MPAISKKGSRMPESPIRKLVPYAEEASRQGKHIYHLNIGQPDIKTPQTALDAIKNSDIQILEYSHSAGNETLRKKLATFYKKHDIELESKEILITTGGSEALVFAIGSITDPGDELIIPEPFYANYYSFSMQSNVTVVPVISRIESGFALPPIADFERLITDKTKAILICNPGNPTGYLYSKEELNQLTELALKHDLYIIADEVYREFVYGDRPHYSILEEERLKEHAIMIDSVSKRFSMCGARIGCLVSRNSKVIDTAMKFAQARLSPPTYGQIAAEAALDVPDSFYKKTVAEYKSRRDMLIGALQEIPRVVVSAPQGAFYCLVGLPVADAEEFAKWLLTSFELNNETLMVAPGSGFYSSPDEGKNQIRIAYVLKAEDLLKATVILKEALEAYQKLEHSKKASTAML